MKAKLLAVTGLEDVALFLLVVLLFPLVILLIGAPVALVVWLVDQTIRAF